MTTARSLSLADAQRPEVMLAYAMNGEPLQPQHGFPLRLLVPGWYGMTSVKWLTSIEAISEPFDGYQQAVAYHYKRDADDPGEPVTRLRVRALMIPPGIPDFFTRQRVVDAGRVVLTRSCLVRRRADRARRGRGRWGVAGRHASGRRWRVRLASVVIRMGRHRRQSRAVLPRNRRSREHPAARPAVELPGSRQQLGPALHRHRSLTDASPVTRRPTHLGRNSCQPYGQRVAGSLACRFVKTQDKVHRMWTKPAEGVDDVEEDPVTLVARTEFPTKATHAQTRAHNASLVLRALYDLGPISRAEIARLTGLTRTSVGELVGELERGGPGPGGRPRPQHRRQGTDPRLARRRRPPRRHPRPRRAHLHRRPSSTSAARSASGSAATSTARTATPPSPSSTT